MPIIGVTTYYVDAAWGAWRQLSSLVPAAYFELVVGAGARPVLLPPVRSAPGGPGAGASDVVGVLDGLVLTGGGDIDPAAYGEEAHPSVSGVDPDRDRSELALLSAALERDLPVLAICRGIQVLNVHRGGSLVQHLPETTGRDDHRRKLGTYEDITIVTTPGSRLASIMGEKATVSCSHHQAVDRLGSELEVTARSADPFESLVEGVELASRRFVVGVQWHPEQAGDRRLFDALVSECTR